MELEAKLDALFADAAVRAFGEEAARSFSSTVRPSKHADYQINGALAFAKVIDKSPREVATDLLKALDDDEGVLESAEIAGPGFINCVFSNGYLAHSLGRLFNAAHFGAYSSGPHHRVVIDYSAPNIAKSMHVGHLRTTIIGDAIVRLLEFRGDQVIKQNHIGDWGTQFGMLIEYLVDSGDPITTAQSSVNDLDALYKAARQKFETDEDFMRRARERVVTLQSGDPETLALWHTLIDTSKQHFRSVYERLGVLLTPQDDAGESIYNDMLEPTINELQQRGLLHESDGALCAFPQGFKGRDGTAFPLMVRKSDGGYGYDTTDLAAIRYRIETLNVDYLIYVTDARQAQHFAMVFQTAREAGWLYEGVNAVHVGYGMVLGEDGKPFKTRTGETVQLTALIDEAIERASSAITERAADLSEADRARVARAVGVGAIKWFDLKNEHVNNYVFDFDRMLAFQGNTGPYVQYASTRAKSVIRKSGLSIGQHFRIDTEQERRLALHLPEFSLAVAQATDELEPHHLCTYLYELANRFTSFYENCPVLTAPDHDTRDARLALCDLTARVIDAGLELLGIEPVDRM